jgi:hypothetical protein
LEAFYSFDLGPEFEIAVCKTLRAALPQKFGICRGHVVTASGDQAGDDIIIYDQVRFPTLRALDEEDYARKEWIPIEAVYAYIEAKHAINLTGSDGSSLQKAINQVKAVKKLCLTRTEVSHTQILPFLQLPEDFMLDRGHGYPSFANPLFTMIVARQIREKEGKKQYLNDAVTINEQTIAQRGVYEVEDRPDAMVLGNGVIALPVIDQEPPAFRSPFFEPKSSRTHLLTVPEISIGIGLMLLLFALDYIQLGRLPWERMVFDCFNPQS